MEIYRSIFEQLGSWKNRPQRKPLILQGARQVGKTWTLKQFGESNFENVAYFNFEKQPGLRQFFSETKEPLRIISNLSIVNGRPIHPGRTLIVFDEIQECNDALNALKYFEEESPEYVIACAGSLLGVAMARGASFPVGKVSFLNMFPVSFSEFLQTADSALHQYVMDLNSFNTIPDIFFNLLTEKLRMYFISGGMPEAVAALLEHRDVALTEEILQSILNAYALDFSKHVDNRDIQKIQLVWNSLPSQLGKENKKFLYRVIKTGARAREYEDALNWLINAGLAYKIFSLTKPAFPLAAYNDLSSFKIYMQDVGLLRRLSHLDPAAYGKGNMLFSEFKGALTENFVLSGLISQFGGLPGYWQSGNAAEVDFLVQYRDMIIPMEVKSDKNIRSKSLTVYRKNFQPRVSVRFSLLNLKKEKELINLPLFMVDHAAKFIDIFTATSV
ncbi:MAG: ATP-binding protein [Bacteroidales bacterium]|nr:ATP-binding protein [Bacteroidales bacterium]